LVRRDAGRRKLAGDAEGALAGMGIDASVAQLYSSHFSHFRMAPASIGIFAASTGDPEH
jgi:hypothetical protein